MSKLIENAYYALEMATEINIPEGASREEAYQALLPQIAALLQDEVDVIANLANTAAAIKSAMGFFWVGFYRKIDRELILGPFQGPVACSRIKITNSVCGTCVQERKTIIVPNVEEFQGHVSCSSQSKSKIVVPLMQGKEVKLVLDIDSDRLKDFSEMDGEYLEQIVAMLTGKYVI